MMSKYDHDNVVPIKQSALSKKDQVADMFDSIAYRYDFFKPIFKHWHRYHLEKKCIEGTPFAAAKNHSGCGYRHC